MSLRNRIPGTAGRYVDDYSRIASVLHYSSVIEAYWLRRWERYRYSLRPTTHTVPASATHPALTLPFLPTRSHHDLSCRYDHALKEVTRRGELLFAVLGVLAMDARPQQEALVDVAAIPRRPANTALLSRRKDPHSPFPRPAARAADEAPTTTRVMVRPQEDRCRSTASVAISAS
jgi:hypothetical protein